MTFLNETMHHESGNLLRAILAGSELDITELKAWRDNAGYTDAQAARLYADIIEEFSDDSPDSLPIPTALSKVSRALWRAGV